MLLIGSAMNTWKFTRTNSTFSLQRLSLSILDASIWFFMLRLHSPDALEDMESDLEEIIPSKVGSFSD